MFSLPNVKVTLCQDIILGTFTKVLIYCYASKLIWHTFGCKICFKHLHPSAGKCVLDRPVRFFVCGYLAYTQHPSLSQREEQAKGNLRLLLLEPVLHHFAVL